MNFPLSEYQFPQPPAPRPPVQHGSGLPVASLVLGVCSLVFCWWGLATLAMVVLSITFGTVGLGRPGRGMAVAGLVLGCVGGVAYLIFGIATLGVGFLI